MVSDKKIKLDLNNIDFSKVITVQNSHKEAMHKVDAVAILTEWDEFKSLRTDEKIQVFDGRNILSNSSSTRGYSIGK